MGCKKPGLYSSGWKTGDETCLIDDLNRWDQTIPRRYSHWVHPFLDEINTIRCMHNAKPVKWNRNLECLAAKWTMHYTKHPNQSAHSCAGTLDMPTYEICGQGDNTARDLVRGWYKELEWMFPAKENYKFQPFRWVKGYTSAQTGEVVPGKWTENNTSGHALTLIWKHQREVGCHKIGVPDSISDPRFNQNLHTWSGTCEFVSDDIPASSKVTVSSNIQGRTKTLDTLKLLLGHKGADGRATWWYKSLHLETVLLEVRPRRKRVDCENGKWKKYA